MFRLEPDGNYSVLHEFTGLADGALPTGSLILDAQGNLYGIATCAVREQKTLVGLTSLLTKDPPLPPKLNRQRALFVLTKIDEILAWEQRKEAERDTKFVELGRHL